MGHARLAAAGVTVDCGTLADAAEHIQRGFLSRIRLGRPLLTLKLATSLDGRIATASGESRWITGPGARAWVHLMRASHDAVLIGAGTARADDPQLTVRGLSVRRQPVRVVAARHLDLPQDGALARTAREVPLWLIHGPDAPEEARSAWAALGARLFEMPAGPDGLDMAALLAALAAAGLTRVLCEGGGQLAAALLRQRLVDDLALFSAGLVLGSEAHAAIGSLALHRLADAPSFRLHEVQRVGADTLSIWTKA